MHHVGIGLCAIKQLFYILKFFAPSGSGFHMMYEHHHNADLSLLSSWLFSLYSQLFDAALLWGMDTSGPRHIGFDIEMFTVHWLT